MFLKQLSITRSHNTNSPVLSNHQTHTPNSVQIHPIINSGYIPPTNISENLENNFVKPKGESQDPLKPPLAMLSQQIFHHQIQRQLSDKDGKQQTLAGMPVDFSANNYKMDFPTVSEMMNSGNQGNNLPFQHQNIQSNLNNNFNNARGQNLRSQDRRFQGYKRPEENHQSLPNASQNSSVMNHNNNNDNITNNSLGHSNTMSNSIQKSIHHQNSFQNDIEKRNRNIVVNNINNNRDNQQNRDRFANLMSHREKRFVVEIQMKQLRSSEPHMHDYYYQKYVERWLDKNTGQMATETPLQEAKIQHPPDKRKLEKENAEKEEKENSNVNGEISNESDSKINKRNSKNGSPSEEHSNKNHSDERSLSKEEELKKYKAPSQPTVADNIESAIAMLGVGLVNKANRPVASQLSRKHSLQSDDQAEFSKNVSDDEMGISMKEGSHEETKPETEDQSQNDPENIQGDQNPNEIDNANPDENDKNNSSNTTKKGLRKNRKKTHKHESALGRMVKTTHHNPRKMIEVVETGDIQISLQQRNLNLRHLEDALLCVVNIINQDMEELERSERFLEEYREPGSEDEEIMTSSANKIEEINQTSPEDSVENNLTPEEQEIKNLEAKEVRKEKYRLKKLRNQHSRLVENFEDDLIKLKYVLGFCMEDGEDPENKEDTLVGQWSTILQWRKGRTLVQRSILALAKLQRGARKKWEIMQKKHEEKETENEEEEQKSHDKTSGPIQNYHICDQKYNETENAVTALTFICRCLRVLIHAENSEKTQLNINHQTNYRSTLLQNFSEVKKAIELLPVFASYEALIELIGLVEDNRKKDILKLKKISDIGLDIVEILPDKFTFSLFCLFIRRIETAIDNYEEEAARFSPKHFHDEEKVNLFDDHANEDYGEFKYLFKKLMSKNQLSKFRDALVVYIEKAVENMGEVHRINIVVARPIVQSKAVFSVLDKFGMDFL